MRFLVMMILYGAALLGAAVFFAVIGIVKTCSRETKEAPGDRDFVNTIALAAGAIFVILAGCIFATTTWRLMGSLTKIVAVAVFAAVSFLAGWAADEKLHIRKTAMACHFLGSVFVCLLAVTAGYFHMLGPVFAFGEDGWWCVLGMGFMGFLGALAAGVLRFQGTVYKKILFLAFQAGTIFLMGCCGMVFWDELMDMGSSHMETAVFGLVCLLMTAAGNGWLVLKKRQEWAKVMVSFAAVGLIHYTVIFLPISTESQFFFMAALMTMCFLALKTFCGMAAEIICILALLADTGILALLELFGPGRPLDEIRLLAALLMLGFALWVWGKRVFPVRILIPFIMWYLVIPVRALIGEFTPWMPEIMWLTFLYVSGLAVWDLVKRELWGPGILAISALSLFLVSYEDASGWEAVWAVLLGIYGCGKAFDGQEKTTWAVLMILVLESLFAGGLANALILEGICFILYFLAHKKENGRLAKGSGILMVLIAVYVMKDFWMDLAWWVYLLAAGIGLMVFAAVREKKD